MTSSIPTAKGQGYEVSPKEVLAPILGKIGACQDTFGELVRHLNALSRIPPLGEGYAKDIAHFNSELADLDSSSTGLVSGAVNSGNFGSMKDALIAAGQLLEKQKLSIQKAIDAYDAADGTAKDGVDCVGGG